MDLSALSAVAPGIMQGQQNAARLQQQQLENQQTQEALATILRQRQGAAWMGAGGMAGAFDAMNPAHPGGAMPAPPQALPRDASPGGMAGAPPAPLAAPGAAGGMPAPDAAPLPTDTLQLQQHLKTSGFDPGALDGVMGPRTQKALADYQAAQGAAAPDAAPAETPSAQPDQQAQGGLDQYDPMQSMRMVMGLADFIQQRYKVATGHDMDPQTLMEQVQRVAEMSNKFTAAQRIGMQGALGQLRADTSTNNNVRTVTGREAVAAGHDATSRANTGDRVGASIENNVRSTSTAAAIAGGHDATSRANTGDRVAAADARAALVDTRQRELAKAQNQVKEDIAAGRNTTASRNALNSAKARLDSARIQMGQAPAETLDDGGTPAAKPSKPAAGAKAWAPPAGLPPPAGVPENTKARGPDGKVAAVIKGGKWAPPPAGS